MLNAVLFVLHAAVIAAIAAAMVRPAWRSRAAVGLTALGVLSLFVAGVGPASRELELFHTFAAYEGSLITLKQFPVDHVTAAGFLWGLVVLVFCAGWALWLWRTAPAADAPPPPTGAGVHPFFGPLALIWSSIALELALQKAAAPAGLVAPLPFDRAILPAALGACVLLAVRCRRVILVLAWLSLLVTFARIPLIVFGTFATQESFGTTLDVHTITLFANPLNQTPLEVAAWSPEQLGWLIWAPNLLVMPALYMLSLGGIGFAVTMFVLHPKRPDHEARTTG